MMAYRLRQYVPPALWESSFQEQERSQGGDSTQTYLGVKVYVLEAGSSASKLTCLRHAVYAALSSLIVQHTPPTALSKHCPSEVMCLFA
jgi:hypothetical protein